MSIKEFSRQVQKLNGEHVECGFWGDVDQRGVEHA